MSQTVEAELRGFFGNAADLVHHRAGTNDRGPVFRFPFTLTHTSFERNRGDRLVRENADVKLTFGAEVLLRRDTTGFDRLRANPAAFERLEPEIAKADRLAAGRVSAYTPSLYFSVLDSFRHSGHCYYPRYIRLD